MLVAMYREIRSIYTEGTQTGFLAIRPKGLLTVERLQYLHSHDECQVNWVEKIMLLPVNSKPLVASLPKESQHRIPV